MNDRVTVSSISLEAPNSAALKHEASVSYVVPDPTRLTSRLTPLAPACL
jgi:hypothetical protein